MKNRFFRAFNYKSMFAQLMAGFLLIVFIMFVFNMISGKIYENYINSEMVNNISNKFEFYASQTEQTFDKIVINILYDFYYEFGDKIRNGKFTAYDIKKLTEKSAHYKTTCEGFDNIFLISKDSDNIVSLGSIYNNSEFFNRYYKNNTYTNDFWQNELNKDFQYKFYSSGYFNEYCTGTWDANRVKHLIPIALKEKENNNFLIVALIDEKMLFESIEPSFLYNFCIYNRLYEEYYNLNKLEETVSSSFNATKAGYANSHGPNSSISYTRVSNGFIFSKHSTYMGLTYYKFVSNSTIEEQIKKIRVVSRFFILISIIVGTVISLFIVRRFNNPVKQIIDLIKSKSDSLGNNDTINLSYLSKSISSIVDNNIRMQNELNKKDSIIESISYTAHILNVFGENKPELNKFFKNGSNFFEQYAVIYFIFHFKEFYFEQISRNTNEGLLIIQELISSYVHQSFKHSVTLQIENNSALSIVNIDNPNELESIVNSVVEKLNYENDYVFFTVVLSNINDNVSLLNSIYKKVVDISKYRTLTQENQILTENNYMQNNNNFVFSDEQKQKFENLLSKGLNDECWDIINDAINYNIKLGINSFSLYLFCIDLISSCKNVLTGLYGDVPNDFTVFNIYPLLKYYDTAEQYKEVCKNLISEYTGFIMSHKKCEDLIIVNIKKYIELNYNKGFNIDEMADDLNISRSYISRYFKQNTGCNLIDYINSFRLNKAMDLLKNPSLKIADVSNMVGINSISSFNRLFKEFTGITPTSYRKGCL